MIHTRQESLCSTLKLFLVACKGPIDTEMSLESLKECVELPQIF